MGEMQRNDSQFPLSQLSSPGLSEKQLEALHSYTDPAELIDILEYCNWNRSAEVLALVRLARQDDNLNVQIKAIKYIRDLVYESLEKSGLLIRATQSVTGEDGRTTTLTAQTVATAIKNAHSERHKQNIVPDEIEREINASQEKEGQKVGKEETSQEGTPHSPPGGAGRSADGDKPGAEPGGTGRRVDEAGDAAGQLSSAVHKPPPSDSQGLFPGLSADPAGDDNIRIDTPDDPEADEPGGDTG